MFKLPVALCLMCVLLAGLAAADVTTQYLGNDQQIVGQTIQGSWPGKVGADGYHLLYWGADEDQKSYPAYLGVAQNSGLSFYQWTPPGSTTDARAVINAAGTQRAASTWYTGGTAYIHSTFSARKTFILGVYMLGWDSDRTAGVAVCARDQETSPPWEHLTTSTMNGYWIFVKVSGAADDEMSIRIRNVSGSPCVSMLSFDPAETAVSEFVVSDATSGSTFYTDSATVNVSLVGEPLEPAAINGYMITTTPGKPEATAEGWMQPADPDAPESPITSFVLPAEGMNTLYGWVRDTEGFVAGKSAAIAYSASNPAITSAAAGRHYTGIEVTWTLDVEACTWLEYGPADGALDKSTAAVFGSGGDIVITGLTAGALYDIRVHANFATFDLEDVAAGPMQFTWQDATGFSDYDGSFNNPDCWSAGSVPGPQDIALLPNTASRDRYITVDANCEVAELQMTQTATDYKSYFTLNANLKVGTINITGSPDSYPFNTNGKILEVGKTTGDTATKGLPRMLGNGQIIKFGPGTIYQRYSASIPFNGSYVANAGVCDLNSLHVNTATMTVNSGATAKETWDWLDYKTLTLNGQGAHDGTMYLGALHMAASPSTTKPITLQTDSTIYVTAAKTLTISGILDGSGGLTKAGPGKIVISGGSKTYLGETIVEEGILEVKTVIPDSHFTVKDGATLIALPALVPGGVTTEGTGVWQNMPPPGWWGNGDPNANGDWSLAANWGEGVVPGEGDVAILGDVSGNGSDGNNIRTVTVAVNEPVTVAGIRMSQPSGGYKNHILLNADLSVGEMTIPGSEWDRCQINVNGRTFTVEQGTMPRFSGTGTIIKNGTGTAEGRYNTSISYTGQIIINSGTFSFWIPRAHTVTVNDGGTMKISWWNEITNAFNLNGLGVHNGTEYTGALNALGDFATGVTITLETDSAIYVPSGQTMTVYGPLTGSGGLYKLGLGKLIFAGVTKNYVGETVVESGTLEVQSVLANSHVTVKAGAKLIGPLSYFPAGVTFEDENPDYDEGPNFWYGGGDGNNNGNWSDASMWVLGYVPAVDGVAILPIVTANGTDGNNTRTVTVNLPITIADVKMPQSGPYVNLIRLDANMTIGRVSELQTWMGASVINVPVDKILTIGDNGTIAFNIPTITGTGVVKKVGTGQANGEYGNANRSFQGQLIVEDGTFYTSQFPDANQLTVKDGATAKFNGLWWWDRAATITGAGFGGNGAIWLAGGNADHTAGIALDGDATINVNAGSTLTQSGSISGTGSLTKIGGGKLTIGGVSTFVGDLIVTQGTVAIESSATIDDIKAIYLVSGGYLDIAGGQNEAVMDLYFNGVLQARGTWGASGSGAMNINNSFFAGRTGVLTVGPAVPVITLFQAVDQTSGSKLLTNSATVGINLAVELPEGVTVAAYVVSQSAVKPETWPTEAIVPTAYTFEGGTSEGAVTLYVWVKGSDEGVGSASATIHYSTATPAVSNVAVAAGAPGMTVATWTTDVAAQGAIQFRAIGATEWTTVSENAVRTAHSITFTGIAYDGTVYQIVVVNNEIAQPAFFYPQTWPIPGDANLDCRVNILDLIFIRNRLNQDVNTADNWKADVNSDGRINILDLIFVRNRLNTMCQ